MKPIKVISFIWVLMLLSCTNTDNPNTEPAPVVISDQVEIYQENLFSNSLVLAVENSGTSTSLIDKTGAKLYTWTFENSLGNDLELLPDGNVLGMFKTENHSISFGGFGGEIKIIRPDNSIEWEYKYSSPNYIAHHDVELLPNGNVLFLAWEKITIAEAQAAGVNVDFDIFPEKLIEVNPNTDQIIWEWRSWDHIVQDLDPNLPKFGDIATNPQLININYNLTANGDIMHANGIDYDALKDVIYISVNFFSEVWVVDHSTTIEEAKISTGGNYNKGGDLLYRFGNPTTYNNTTGERLFYNNHNPNIIENGEPGEGNLLIYVNGFNVTQSSVYELDIPDTFSLTPHSNNEPLIVWIFTDENLFFGKISGASRLSNGNTLICEGDYGFWEVTPNGEVAWKYNALGTPMWRGYGYNRDHVALPHLGISF